MKDKIILRKDCWKISFDFEDIRDYFVFILNRTIAMEHAKRRDAYAVNRYGYVV